MYSYRRVDMKKIMDLIEKFVEKVLMGLLSVFISIVILQVAARYVFNSPLTWTEQTARYMFIWMVMLGIPIAFRKNMNAAFDLITNRLNKKYVSIINIINTILITFFAGYYFVNSLSLVLRSTKTIVQGIDIPINYIYIAQPICAVILFIFCIEKLVNELKIINFQKAASEGGN